MSADTRQNRPHAAARVCLVADDQHPLAALTEYLLASGSADLSNAVVLVPDLLVAPALRALLLERAATLSLPALLGPEITTLRRWVAHHAPLTQPVLHDQARELMLVEALLEHGSVFGAANPWSLADSLIPLFDELTLHGRALPEDYDSFVRSLGRAYGLDKRLLAGLSQEARVVHALWRAWHAQQCTEGALDREAAYVAQLGATLQDGQTQHYQFYLAGCVSLSPPELTWVSTMRARAQMDVFLSGRYRDDVAPDDYHPDAPTRALVDALGGYTPSPAAPNEYAAWLDAVYAPAGPDTVTLAARARDYARAVPQSPAVPRLAAFHAADAEEEASAIEIQIRRWLLDGCAPIAVITEDRLLARRLRALLERAQVDVDDAGGWALSTTRAAAALERWLQTVEEDFAYLPLTDLLCSAFIFPERDAHALKEAAYRLEHDIILNENIPRGIKRYRRHLADRAQRLGWSEYGAVRELLDNLEHAATPLTLFLDPARTHAPVRLLDALELSLERLGMARAYAQDAAGIQILDVLMRLRRALHGRSLRMTWTEFRAWIGRALERATFRLPAGDGRVHIMGLEQSALGHHAAVIIAAADRDHLPGTAAASPFFNQAVRRELGLTNARDYLTRRFYLFRRLLAAAPRVLITVCTARDGEPVVLSPWLEALQSFHRLAYGAELPDMGLQNLVNQPAAQVQCADTTPMPAPVMRHPAPTLTTPALMPATISASAYQQLIDCPYQFYAARCLNLAPSETIKEALEKADYGERVHRALQALHMDVPGLPGPYRGSWRGPAERDAAITCLMNISEAVFARDVEDNFEHRGWLTRWCAVIPEYIDWEIQRHAQWRVTQVEVETDRPLSNSNILLRGRLDRVDTGPLGTAVLDYKTGRTPHDEDVTGGEAVQLPYYALLTEPPPHRVEYLALDNDKVGSRAMLEGEELLRLAHAIAQRLSTMTTEICEGTPMPAWGDDNVCEYCRMSGLCRRAAWSE